MAIKCKIKKGDQVVIIAGDDKGKKGVVKAVYPKASQVVVEGCKVAKKAMKATQENPKGGHKLIEQPIHISNVKKVEE
jgi:large subunit ribosomal protein L24